MKHRIVLSCLALLAASCVMPARQSRISKNAGIYSQLSPEHRQLVAAGNIAEGMSKDAVFLAWGSPARAVEVNQDGGQRERWDYSRIRPVPTTSVGFGYGRYPYHPHHRYDHFDCIDHNYPRTAYIPEKIATVWFANDRVVSWERVK